MNTIQSIYIDISGLVQIDFLFKTRADLCIEPSKDRGDAFMDKPSKS